MVMTWGLFILGLPHYILYIYVCLYSNTQHDRIENHTEIVIDHVTIFFGLCYTRTHIDYERVFNIQCAVQCGVFLPIHHPIWGYGMIPLQQDFTHKPQTCPEILQRDFMRF